MQIPTVRMSTQKRHSAKDRRLKTIHTPGAACAGFISSEEDATGRYFSIIKRCRGIVASIGVRHRKDGW